VSIIVSILEFIVTGIVGWFIINFILGVYVYYKEKSGETVTEKNTSPKLADDWYFPIKVAYSTETWYAWDKEDIFIHQASNRNELLNDILNKFDMSPKRLKIISEGELENETTA